MACKRGDLSESEKKLFEYVNTGAVNDVKCLLKEADVRVDCLDENGMTPLQQAAYRGNRQLCEMFLASGADVNSNYHDSGYTALMFAALSGSLEATRVILEAGAIVEHTNSVGRNAAQMAAFVGQHQVVSLINNFFSLEDLEYYTKPQGLEKEPKLPAHLATNIYKLILNNNMKTVKICLFLQQHKNLLEDGHKVYRFFETLCEKMMKQKGTNEIMAMKFHYFYCAIQKCVESRDNLDAWIKSLLKWDDNMFEMEQEKFIRTTYTKFPYTQNQLIQQMVRQLHNVQIGGNPTALDVLDQAINGQRMPSETERNCGTCGDQGDWKKCTACKYISYCSKECQKLHWFTHKKFCKKLAEMVKAEEEHKRLMEEQEKLEQLRLQSEEAKEQAQSETKQAQSETKQAQSETTENITTTGNGTSQSENVTNIDPGALNMDPGALNMDPGAMSGGSGESAKDTAKTVKELLAKGRDLLDKKDYPKAVDVFQRVMELDATCQEAVELYRKAFMHDLVDPDDIKKRAQNSPQVQEMIKNKDFRKKLEEMQKDPEKLRQHLQDDKTAKEVEKLLEYALIDP